MLVHSFSTPFILYISFFSENDSANLHFYTFFQNISRFLVKTGRDFTHYSDVGLGGKVLAKVFEDAMKLDELLGTEGGYAIEELKITCMPGYDWLTNPLIRVVDIAKALLCDDTLLDSYLGDCEGEKVCKSVVGILKKYVK